MKKQNERLLEYLEGHRVINPLDAWDKLGIYRLSARICDLRKAGHKIDDERITVQNRFGEDCRVARYWLSV